MEGTVALQPVGDPERIDADPDPTFQAEVDPNPNFFR